MTSYFDQVVNLELQKCKTPKEMLEALNKHYDLNKEIGPMTSLAFRQGLRTAVNMIKPTIKKNGL